MRIISLFKLRKKVFKQYKAKRRLFGSTLILGSTFAVSTSILAAPDLTFSSVTGFSTSYYVGQPMPKFTFTIKNSGNSAYPKEYNDESRQVMVDLEDCYYKRNANGEIYSCPQDISAGGPRSVTHILGSSGLPPGTSFSVNWPLLWSGMPTKSFKIAGDYHMLFRLLTKGGGETSFTNNAYSVDFTVNTTTKNLNLKPTIKHKLMPKKLIQPN